jgi:hypothetical protein
MQFDELLDEAVKAIPLAKIDKRLASKSKLTAVKSHQDHMPPPPGVVSLPLDVNVNIRRDNVPLSDSIQEAAPMAEIPEEEPEAEAPEEEAPGAEAEEPEITDDDLPSLSGQEQIPGLPSGSNYTLEMAKGQLDGILGKWIDLAGNYPEGDKRHQFIEIGERLREISAVLQRDYIGDQSKTQF